MQSVKETLTRQAGLGQLMPTSLLAIAQKAKELKNYRFRNLYGLLNQQNLKTTWKHINKRAASGVDKITAREFARDLDSNIAMIVETLKHKRYRAKLVRRVHIPKDNKGKTRPLGIPAIADKLVQSSAAKILDAIYEQDFIHNSYGYRPKVGAQTAIKDLTKELQNGKYGYIVEADIKGYFDHIDHDWLLKMLEQRIADRTFISLINKWLKAGILETDGQVIHPATGTPQGGIISPILANIYLHYVLDIWFEKRVKPNCEGEAYLCRYADDHICAFRYKKDAERYYKALRERLRSFGLELAEEKTNIIRFSRFLKDEKVCFEFLGFEFRWRISRKGTDLIKRRTSRKKLNKSISNFKIWCKENRNNRLARIFKELNTKLRGYYNYYGVIGNYKSLMEFYQIARKILFKWLNRKSQRRSFNWQEFQRILKRYQLLLPRITETTYQQIEFEFRYT